MTPHPELDLWEPVVTTHLDRVVATSEDRVAWIRARSRGVTATDAARLSSERSLRAVAQDKLLGSGFSGNAFTDHGRAREPEIARWVRATHRIEPSTTLFHAQGEPRHLATPDGVGVHDGTVVLSEIKTTGRPWCSIPRSYLRQVWWQQYVLGAERTLVVWEQHDNFVPIAAEPQCQWVERDENEIHRLVVLASRLLDLLQR
ncbi:YqaJ viral recombinase family protein [Antiquaquibacter oligotrophicus]|uniref:YqaJ viral recombinase family protein n=1 Tax=Antiquaquibacter oligotrophicus TaxID=2880260 RepID=UPI002AC94AA4|nr:YqaJ viral recombinase family protein [Antiquaquibacter oligotrophicus]UDF12376.1 YqaJ viral recombinase family protein [Antiquaquibacter oligotrophicus]